MLRDELLRDARKRDPSRNLERLEATLMAMATKTAYSILHCTTATQHCNIGPLGMGEVIRL